MLYGESPIRKLRFQSNDSGIARDSNLLEAVICKRASVFRVGHSDKVKDAPYAFRAWPNKLLRVALVGAHSARAYMLDMPISDSVDMRGYRTARLRHSRL